MSRVSTEDIIEFGMIPEFVGRLPVLSSLGQLDHAGLVKVLTEPKNSLVKQYESLFEMEECSLKFTADALDAIAAKAVKRGTGARGLRSIIEESMLDIMYELPDQPKGSAFEVNGDVINGRKPLFEYTPPTAKSA